MLGSAPNVEWKRKRKNSSGGRANGWGGREIADDRPRPQIARPPIGRVHAQSGAAVTGTLRPSQSPPREAPPPKPPPTDRLGERDAIIATHVLIRTVHERRRRRRRCGDRRCRRRGRRDSGHVRL